MKLITAVDRPDCLGAVHGALDPNEARVISAAPVAQATCGFDSHVRHYYEDDGSRTLNKVWLGPAARLRADPIDQESNANLADRWLE